MTETAENPVDTELECYDVVLVTTDGVESTVRSRLRDNGSRSCRGVRLVLKSACQAGGCGACSAVLSGGRVEMGEHDPDVIETPEEDGGILLCRSLPARGLPHRAAVRPGQVVTAPPSRHQARITGLDRVADGGDAAAGDAARRAAATRRRPDFESGQFVRINVPGRDARRAYSPANVANWDGELEFYIRLLPGGAMSEYLIGTAAVGDELDRDFCAPATSAWSRTDFGRAGSSPGAPACRRCCRCCAGWPSGETRSPPGSSSGSPGTPRCSPRRNCRRSPRSLPDLRCRHRGVAQHPELVRSNRQPCRPGGGRGRTARTSGLTCHVSGRRRWSMRPTPHSPRSGVPEGPDPRRTVLRRRVDRPPLVRAECVGARCDNDATQNQVF